MALTASSRFTGFHIHPKVSLEPSRISWSLTDGTEGRISFNPWPAAGSQDLTDLGILQDIWAANDGALPDADGNDLVASIDTVFQVFDGMTYADFAKYGFTNPIGTDAFNRRSNRFRTRGAFMQHSTVSEDSTTGRLDIRTTGGLEPRRGVPDTGVLRQGLADVQVEASGSSNARLRINARPGEPFTNATSGGDAGTEVADDSRVRGLIKYLQDHLTGGDDLYTSLDDITEWAGGIFSGRTFTIDQDTGSATSNFEFTVSSITAGRTRLTLTTAKTGTSPSADIDKLNALFNTTAVTFDTDAADERPPFGKLDIPLVGERLVMPDGEIIVIEGIPTWRDSSTQRLTPIGSIYGSVYRWEDLDAVDGETYRRMPRAYNIAYVHIEATERRKIMIPDPRDIVPFPPGGVDLEIHNNNAHDGSLVDVVTSADVNIATLLGKEHLPLRIELFKDGSGEIRTPTRFPRTFEVAGDDIGHLGDLGHWASGPNHWARPLLFPATTRQTQIPPVQRRRLRDRIGDLRQRDRHAGLGRRPAHSAVHKAAEGWTVAVSPGGRPFGRLDRVGQHS